MGVLPSTQPVATFGSSLPCHTSCYVTIRDSTDEPVCVAPFRVCGLAWLYCNFVSRLCTTGTRVFGIAIRHDGMAWQMSVTDDWRPKRPGPALDRDSDTRQTVPLVTVAPLVAG